MRIRANAAATALAAHVVVLFGLSATAVAQAPKAALSIEEAVAEAVRNNPALLAERASIPIAEARVLTARLRPNPTLSAGGANLDLLGTGFDEINGGGPTEIAVGAEFLFERGGKRQRRVEVAAVGRAVTELLFQDAVRALTLDVKTAFAGVLLARDNLALARENLAAMNRIVEVNAARVKAGDLAELELVRSRVAALHDANSLRRAELEMQTAGTRLRALMGRSANSPPFEVTGELERAAAIPGLEELRTIALESRPDLRALRMDGERAQAEVRLQLAQARPDYTLGAEYRRQQVNAKANTLTFTVNVPLPLFDRNQGEIARSRQEQIQARLRVQARQLTVAAEVEDASSRLQAAQQLLATIEGKLLGDAREARDITDFAYRNGEATLLELLDAQRAFNQTIQAYNDTRAEYAQSLYLLEAVCGRAVTK